MGSHGIAKQAYLVKLKFCCMFFEKIVIGDTVTSTQSNLTTSISGVVSCNL